MTDKNGAHTERAFQIPVLTAAQNQSDTIFAFWTRARTEKMRFLRCGRLPECRLGHFFAFGILAEWRFWSFYVSAL
ncbi:MAG: hypothetical protein II811_05555 [Spirochaetaceae bacterium]|nr:hypothetical protein [Spirochaetaceae bacterium]